jgi:hypothetical protein
LYLLRKMSAWEVHFNNTWETQQEEWGYNGGYSAVSYSISLSIPNGRFD